MKNIEPPSQRPHSSSPGASVLAALDRIPETYRLPLWLRFCMGFGPAETAETLAIPEQTLPGLLDTGMRKLSQAMGTIPPFTDPSATTLAQALAGARAKAPAKALAGALAKSPRETAPSSLLEGIRAIAAHGAAPAPRVRSIRRSRLSARQRACRPSSAAPTLTSGEKITLGNFGDIHWN